MVSIIKLKCVILLIWSMLNVLSATDVIIVGAGISGISAARKLVNTGGYHVTVLEARNRVGGRMWTDLTALTNAKGTEVDKGASWIHGSNPLHPITQLAEKFNLSRTATNDELMTVWNVDGSEADLENSWLEFQQLLQRVNSEATKSSGDISVWDTIVNAGLEEEAKKPSVAYWIQLVLEFSSGGQIGDISANNLEDAFKKRRRKKRESEDLLINGYVGIINGLIGGIQGETAIKVQSSGTITRGTPTILLNNEVTKIEQFTKDNTKKVKVYSDSSIFEADYVIVSVPLGVLKAENITFYPTLSSNKLSAISNVGFGNVNKLILEWSESFWDEWDYLTYFGRAPDVWETRGMLNSWLNVKSIVNRPVLVGYALGPSADTADALTVTQLKDKGVSHLNDMFGGNVPEPVEWSKSNWGVDPYARGCYSFFKVGTEYADFTELAQNECPYIFAGEHTNDEDMSSVHGAYNSGLRAAGEVIQANKGGCSSILPASSGKSITASLYQIFILFVSLLIFDLFYY